MTTASCLMPSLEPWSIVIACTYGVSSRAITCTGISAPGPVRSLHAQQVAQVGVFDLELAHLDELRLQLVDLILVVGVLGGQIAHALNRSRRSSTPRRRCPKRPSGSAPGLSSATVSRPRHGPGIRKTTANTTTTRVLTQRGSRRRGGSLIISDTADVRSAGPRVPYAELRARSIPCRCRARRSRADLRPDAPASWFCATADRPGQATGNRRRPA